MLTYSKRNSGQGRYIKQLTWTPRLLKRCGYPRKDTDMTSYIILILSAVLLILPAVEGQFHVFYANDDQLNNNTVKTFHPGNPVLLACQYSTGDEFIQAYGPAVLIEYFNNDASTRTLDAHKETYNLNTFLNYTISGSESDVQHTYRCYYMHNQDNFIQVTISFDDSTDPPSTDPPSTDPPTTDPPSTDPPFTAPSSGTTDSPSSGTDDSPKKFTGLNPLIYTISAVVLLGTLAIVAIITCWIRARRSFHHRVLQPNSTPQDYLDYISDNEFTPLTTSEFLASMQERPPTYNESEEIQGQVRVGQEEEGGNSNSTAENSSQAPPLPARNQQRRRSQERRSDQDSRETSERTQGSDSETSPPQEATGNSVVVLESLVEVHVHKEEDLLQEPSLPTEEQIAEIEAAVNEVCERINRIHERDQEITRRVQEGDSPSGESPPLITPLLDAQV